MEHAKEKPLVTPRSVARRVNGKLVVFLEALGLGALFRAPERECTACGAPGPSGGMALLIDPYQRPQRCSACGMIVDENGHGIGRRLPSGRVVLAEIAFIEHV